MTRADRLNAWWENLDKRYKVLVVLGVFILLAIAIDLTQEKGSYTIDVGGNGLGDFNAVTVNTGSKAGSPTCRVWALDTFGNRIGSDSFELRTIAPDEVYRWNGHVQVNEVAARYGGEC